MAKKSRGSITLEACCCFEALLLASIIMLLVSLNVFVSSRNQVFLNQCASEIAALGKLQDITPEGIETYYNICSLQYSGNQTTQVNENIVDEVIGIEETEAIERLNNEPQNLTYCTALLVHEKIDDERLKNIVAKAHLANYYNTNFTNEFSFFNGVNINSLDLSQSYFGKDKISLICRYRLTVFDMLGDSNFDVDIEQRSVANTW